MKRIIIVILVFLIMACTTTSIGPINGSYPKTPEGQSLIRCAFEIQTFDGKPAGWARWENIVIPAGKHTLVHKRSGDSFILESRSYSRTTRSGVRDEVITTTHVIDYDYITYDIVCEITYDFQKGKEYKILGDPYADSHIRYIKSTKMLIVSEGTQLTFNEKGNHMLVIPEVKVEEEKGSPYIRPEASGLMSTGMAFGGIIISPIGERFGLGIIGGKADIKLVGLGQFGIFMPFKNAFGMSYNFGGLLEYNFPKIGIGVGGGMGGTVAAYEGEADEYGWNRETVWETPFQPYLEFNLTFRRDINKSQHGIYLHYYPSSFPSGESNWYNIIGFGYKLHTQLNGL
jgi:hypothetical protein